MKTILLVIISSIALLSCKDTWTIEQGTDKFGNPIHHNYLVKESEGTYLKDSSKTANYLRCKITIAKNLMVGFTVFNENGRIIINNNERGELSIKNDSGENYNFVIYASSNELYSYLLSYDSKTFIDFIQFSQGNINCHIEISNYNKSYSFTLHTEGFLEEYNKYFNIKIEE